MNLLPGPFFISGDKHIRDDGLRRFDRYALAFRGPFLRSYVDPKGDHASNEFRNPRIATSSHVNWSAPFGQFLAR